MTPLAPSKLLRAAAVAAALSASAFPARAAEDVGARWQVDVGVPLWWMDGHTTYEIAAGNQTASVRSELEFPLAAFLAGLRVRAVTPRFEDGSRLVLEAVALHSVVEGTGTLKDSDWLDGTVETAPPPDGVGVAHPGKDIYSTSRTTLGALVLEGRVAWRHDVAPGLRLAPAAGLLYQSFSLAAYDVNQVGYGPWATTATLTVPGKGLTYDVSWRALHVGAQGELDLGPVTLALDAWYSPLVHAEDDDEHLLRFKSSRTSADGSGWYVGAEGRGVVGAADAFSLRASLMSLDATGTQRQSFYAGRYQGQTGTIGATLTSMRWMLGVTWAHRL